MLTNTISTMTSVDGGDVLGGLTKGSVFGMLGDGVGKMVADGWTGIMLTFWSSGLWILRLVLQIMDRLLTPDLSEKGPAGEVYRYTFWLAASILVLIGLCQIGVAMFRRDGKSLARLGIGVFQFVGVWAGWISYAVVVVAACGGITHALMKSLLGINSWSHWNPMGNFNYGEAAIGATIATVLGVLGFFVWIAAIGHFFVMLWRGAALLILSATSPLSAAGLAGESTKVWFWKSFRWFHAAALTPVLTVLCLGIGVKMTTSVAQGKASGAAAAVGTAFPSVMIMLISITVPVALFRLLAFVDPGTTSGANMRAGLAASGGIQGLLGGGNQTSSSTASTPAPGGQSQGEQQSGDATSSRFGSIMSSLGGAPGQAYAKTMGAIQNLGAQAASQGSDEMNSTGVGDGSYFPDYSRGPQNFSPDQRDPQNAGNNSGGNPTGGDQGPPSPPPSAGSGGAPPALPGGGSGGGAGGGAASGGGAAAAGGGAGAASAGAVPPVA